MNCIKYIFIFISNYGSFGSIPFKLKQHSIDPLDFKLFYYDTKCLRQNLTVTMKRKFAEFRPNFHKSRFPEPVPVVVPVV